MTLPASQTNDRIDVAVVPHPFAIERIHARIPAGGTIAEIVAAAQPDPALSGFAHVYIDGHYVPSTHWRRVRPRAGTVVSIRMVPRGGGGGGGKNPLRTVLSLALVAASPIIAGGLAAALGATAQATFLGINAGRIITAGVNLLGRLALNALAPPGKPRFGSGLKESPTLFLQGARNQAYPFARVPKVLGRHRFVPPLGALPYTETVGNEQYIRMLFVWGYGPLHISDIRIGETPISEFDDVEIETRQGYAEDPPLTLYSNSVMQNDMEVVLREADGFVLRTTDTEADEISVDITLPRGLVRYSGSGAKQSTTVHLEIQYSPAGENDWSAGATSFKSFSAQSYTLPPRPDGYRQSGHAAVVTRYDRIVMDPASGALRVISGPTRRVGIDNAKAEIPPLPPGMISLARVERLSSESNPISAGKITDERTAASIGSFFETPGDFLVSASPHVGRVEIAAGGLTYPGLFLTGKQSAALRRSVSFRVPRGRYDVRIRRVTADSQDDNTFDETVWTALRTVRHAYPVNMTGLAMTALRIRATDQLNGVVERLNGVVHSILPDWDGEAWVEQVTSNPAALFRHVLQGSANARSLGDHRLDLQRLQEWHAHCTENGREFNAVIDYDVSVREVLQDIAAAGRASPTVLDGKWAVIEDRPQTVPVQHFTPYNTFGFQGRKAFDEVPQALRVRFINRDKGWLHDERLVFADGYDAATATRYETLTLTGVTDAGQAWKDGRYHLATAQLRPESYSFYCDIEHIVCTRGDLIRFTHDVPMFGLAGSRVAALVADPDDPGKIIGVDLDSAVTMEPDRNYAVRFRLSDGTSLPLPVETLPGTAARLVFSVPQNGDIGLAAGDLALFGLAGQESVELVVKSIEPQNDLNAKLTCVDAAPAIHGADSGAIPAFSSQITVPQELQRPPAPVVSHIQSGAEALIRHADGSVTTRVMITLKPPSFPARLQVQAQIRAKDESAFRAAEIFAQSPTHVSLTDVAEGEIYDIRLRYFTDTGIFSPPATIAGHSIAGAAELPSNVEDISMNVIGPTAYLSWTPVTDIDLSHYSLRFSPLMQGADWNGATDVILCIPPGTTAATAPARAGTYLLKAVDQGGRHSAEPARVVSDIATLTGYNALLEFSEAPAFAGICNGTVIEAGTLQLQPQETSGSYYFLQKLDLGAVYTSLLTATLGVSGLDRAETADDWPNVDDVDNRDGNADPSQWSVQLQLRTTQDDVFLSSENLIESPKDFATADWTKTRCAVAANDAAAPDGTQTADKLIATAESGTHFVSQLITAANSDQTVTASLCFKAAEHGFAFLAVSKSATEAADAVTLSVDLATGAMTAAQAGTAAAAEGDVESLGNGWWRATLTGVVDAAAADPVYLQCRIATAPGVTSFTGDDAGGIYVWGAQALPGETPYSPAWSPWRNFMLGEYTARGYQFRALLSGETENITPVVGDLRVALDMPDRIASGAGILSDPGGTGIVFDRAFRAAPAVAVTAQDMSAGDYHVITDVSESGFSIRFHDSGGNGVARRFDYMAKGYGEQL